MINITKQQKLALLILLLLIIIGSTITIISTIRAFAVKGELNDYDIISSNLKKQIAKVKNINLKQPVNSTETIEPPLLKGKTFGIAGANLQKIVSVIVNKNGGTVKSIQLADKKIQGNLVGVSINTKISTDINGLQKILYNIETGSPYLFIEGLIIRKINVQDNPFKKVMLDISLKVTGFMPKNRDISSNNNEVNNGQ